MKLKMVAGISLLAVALVGCSKAPTCTQEELTKKAGEITAAVQQVVTKDPSKAQGIVTKMQELAAKYQGQTDLKDACKAYDDVLATIKGS